MKKEKDKKDSKSSKDFPQKGDEEQAFEEKKRAAYSAMGKLGGLARARQMAEKGFTKSPDSQSSAKNDNKQQKNEVNQK